MLNAELQMLNVEFLIINVRCVKFYFLLFDCEVLTMDVNILINSSIEFRYIEKSKFTILLCCSNLNQ